MIKFIKTLKYQTAPENQDRFEFLTALTRQEINPDTTSHKNFNFEEPIILASPLNRVQQTLPLTVKNQKIITMVELAEVLFDLRLLCTRQEHSNQGGKIVRTRFKQAFVSDNLKESREHILKQIKLVLQLCLFYREQNIVIVSHSFRLKLIEAFIKTKGRIENKPHLIHKFISRFEKTYEFGQGFIIDLNELDFLNKK